MVMILSPSSFDRRVNLAIRLFPAYFAASKNSFLSEDSLFLCKRNEEAHHRPVIANRGPMLLPRSEARKATSPNPPSASQSKNSIGLTAHPLAACVCCNQVYLFWQADDPSNSIYFASYNDVSNNTSWPPGRKINNVDHTPASPAACLFAGQFHVFWKADDPSNRILDSLLS